MTARARQPDGRRLALRWLEVRALTRAELVRRLERAGVSAPADTVAELAEHGWVDDRRVAAAERDRAERRRDGPRRLAARLRQRGVDRDLQGEILEQVEPETWAAQAWQVAERVPYDEANRGRLARQLQRRGYPAATIARVLDRWADNGRSG